jgi:hypothetical protein
MPDPFLPRDLDQIAESTPTQPRGLASLRAMLRRLPPLTPSMLPGVSPAMLPEDEGTASSTATPTGAGSPAASGLAGAQPGSIPGSAISPRSLPAVVFASNIVPPTVWSGSPLPTLPSAQFPEGSLLVWIPPSGDGKLYRNVSNAWTRAVSGAAITDGGDVLANSITAGSIAVGAIGAVAIAANAITAEKLAVGGVGSGNLVKNGSFEDADASLHGANFVAVTTSDDQTLTRGWGVTATTRLKFGSSVNAKTGSYIGIMEILSGQSNYRMIQDVPIIAGRKYRLSGWHWKTASGGVTNQLRVNSVDKSGNVVTYQVMSHDTTASTPQYAEDTYTVPSDGTVSFLRVELLAYGSPSGTETFCFEDIALTEVQDNLTNPTGEVIIDSSGIAITNGKLSVNGTWPAALVATGRNLLSNSSFEIAPVDGFDTGITSAVTACRPYWDAVTNAGIIQFKTATSGLYKTGTHSLRITGNSSNSYPALVSHFINVQPGRRYRLSGWMTKTSGTASYAARLALPTYDADGTVVSNPAVSLNQTSNNASLQFYEVEWTCPTDASVTKVRVQIMVSNVPTSGDVAYFEDICFEEIPTSLKNYPAEVVIDKDGITVTNGAITVSNAGATVIIDGTSNMFKIAASGSLNVTATAGNNNSATTTLTGLGTQATIPGQVSWCTDSNVATDTRYAFWLSTGTASGYVALTSGGSPTQEVAIIRDGFGMLSCHLDASDYAVVRIYLNNAASASSTTLYSKYHVLKEAAL